ncbi:MAG TPA: tyrosinase family protein [Bryobacteraceae bacterium]|nr:tyrosinase family protein [Bryobacteraceae bacterium]
MADTPSSSKVRTRPAVPSPIRIRRNVVTMAANDPVLVFYGRAIGEMKTLPIADPLSWRYQAAIHDYPAPGSDLTARQLQDPFADASDVLPSDADRTRFWGVCQHASWFFLPWHRMYLHFFEKIVLRHVVRLGGPADWALPYWNYSTSDAARRLPEAFRSPTLADGSVNHLFVGERDPRANAGNDFADAGATATTALSETVFAGPPGGTGGFGGRFTVAHHGSGGDAKGAVERLPHDAMHGAVSGPTEPRLPNGRQRGFMGSFVRAPLDPIFWIHHCNIDRLWSEWRRLGRSNPTEASWRTAVTFSFHDAASNIVDMTSSDVEETRPAPLAYIYDDEPI